MRSHWFLSSAATLAVLAGTAIHAASQPVERISWSFHAVGTPEFDGEPKIWKPGYVEPAPVDVKLSSEVPCSPGLAVGEFEAFVNSKDVVEQVHSHYELKLTPFHGHLIVLAEGVQSEPTASPQAAVSGAIS